MNTRHQIGRNVTNNPHDNVINVVGKLEVESRTGGPVDSEEGYQRIQQHIDILGKWAKGWPVGFNSDKCKVLHFGKFNQGKV